MSSNGWVCTKIKNQLKTKSAELYDGTRWNGYNVIETSLCGFDSLLAVATYAQRLALFAINDESYYPKTHRVYIRFWCQSTWIASLYGSVSSSRAHTLYRVIFWKVLSTSVPRYSQISLSVFLIKYRYSSAQGTFESNTQRARLAQSLNSSFIALHLQCRLQVDYY